MSELTEKEAEELALYLGEITNHTELDALALVTREGLRIAFSAIPGYNINPDQLSAISSVILQGASEAVSKIGYDYLSECVIRGEHSYLVLAAAGRFFLIGASRELKDLSKIVTVFRFYAKKITELFAK